MTLAVLLLLLFGMIVTSRKVFSHLRHNRGATRLFSSDPSLLSVHVSGEIIDGKSDLFYRFLYLFSIVS